jgi:tRNA-Thr(GGU) m(6)t(6)A37 methyltransferase TsaA
MEKKNQRWVFKAIGYVENEFAAPAPPEAIRAKISRIVIDRSFTDGLYGLEDGAKLVIVFCFHRSIGYDLLQHPRGDLDLPWRGVFTICSPYRPNPIGVTVVELVSIEDNVLCVRGLDAIDGTPVLDIKPASTFSEVG